MATRFRPIAKHRRTRRMEDDKANYEMDSNDMEDDEENESSPLPMWKSVAIAVIVIACFASIYPKLLHPILMYMLGHSGETKKTDDDVFGHPVHPSGFGGSPMPQSGQFHHRMAGMNGRGPIVANAPHQYEEESAGRSTGTWQWLLPFYTIGVVVFLLYTLSKILWRRPKIDARHKYNFRYNPQKDRFEASCPGMDSEIEEEVEGEENTYSMYYDEEVNPEIAAPICPDLGNNDLQNLQQRLHETETAMQRILSQLEQISTVADSAQVEQLKMTAEATLNNLSKINPVAEKSPGRSSLERTVIRAHQKVLAEEKRKADLSPIPFVDTGDVPYISDLEKALTDFQRISETYVCQNSKKGKHEVQKLRNFDHDEGPSGFDVMESEACLDSLTLPEGEGEIIPLEASKEAMHSSDDDHHVENRKKKVRRRKGKKHISH